MEMSREFGLSPHVIEKDYTLGWVLAGISNHRELEPNWVFKGGTCLKKCYLETYRFSEDLDFTLINPDQMDEQFLIETFGQISEWIYEHSGIEIPMDLIRFDVYKNPRGNQNVQGRISYRGPMQRGGDLPRIKLDLTCDELLVLEPVIREVHHPYSDKPKEGIRIRSYCLEEVFAEKIRALAERKRPRDLYDVIHIHQHNGFKPDRVIVLNTLESKSNYKGISTPTMETFGHDPEQLELKTEWENMLSHQLPLLPGFEQFWEELPKIFNWLYGRSEKIEQPEMSLRGTDVDESWRPPPMGVAWKSSASIEIIRYAAANHLCIDMFYQGTNRRIEPYSLRRTRDRKLLLYALKHDTKELRAYRVDRIQGVEVSKELFIPQFKIELSPSMPVSSPPTARK